MSILSTTQRELRYMRIEREAYERGEFYYSLYDWDAAQRIKNRNLGTDKPLKIKRRGYVIKNPCSSCGEGLAAGDIAAGYHTGQYDCIIKRKGIEMLDEKGFYDMENERRKRERL